MDMDSDKIRRLYVLNMINTTSSMENALHHYYIFCVHSHLYYFVVFAVPEM